ncbi:MAG: phosphoserine phosphatase SerB [Candidatus Methylumidiphilus sp.]
MRLVVQGITAPEQLRHIAALCGNPQPAALSAQAYSLRADSQRHAEISAYCLAQSIDCAWVPNALTLDHVGLVVMDMDSTLIGIETIDEIADLQGLRAEVAAITEQAMRGEIDYAQSLRQRVALLAGEDESALWRVYDERLALNPGAETLLAELRRRGIKTLLVSGGFDFFTSRLKERLGLDYAAANTLEIVGGKLTGRVLGEIIDAQAKADWLNRVRGELGLALGQVVAIGDGANDLKMLAAAGFGIAYHAKPIVRAQADCALNFAGLDGVLHLLAGHPAPTGRREARQMDCA